MGRTLDEDESRFIHGCSLGSWGRRGGEWGNHAQPAAAKLLILRLHWFQSPSGLQGCSSTHISLSAALAPAPSLSLLPSRLLLRRCSASDPSAQSQSPPSHAQSAQVQRDEKRTWVRIPAPPAPWRHDMCSFHCLPGPQFPPLQREDHK